MQPQPDSTPGSQPRFLADVMLGSLARWLRILGYDTVYDNRIEDEEIVHRCLKEDRIALTRDARLVRRRSLRQRLLIQSNDLGGQLREVLESLNEQPNADRMLTRCLECNTELEKVAKDQVVGRTPPYVYATQSEFKECPSCSRVYWGGTHREHILQRLARLLGAAASR